MAKIASELLVERLAEWGVDTVFGFNGLGDMSRAGQTGYDQLPQQYEN
jgi:hypothetical protein